MEHHRGRSSSSWIKSPEKQMRIGFHPSTSASGSPIKQTMRGPDQWPVTTVQRGPFSQVSLSLSLSLCVRSFHNCNIVAAASMATISVTQPDFLPFFLFPHLLLSSPVIIQTLIVLFSLFFFSPFFYWCSRAFDLLL